MLHIIRSSKSGVRILNWIWILPKYRIRILNSASVGDEGDQPDHDLLGAAHRYQDLQRGEHGQYSRYYAVLLALKSGKIIFDTMYQVAEAMFFFLVRGNFYVKFVFWYEKKQDCVIKLLDIKKKKNVFRVLRLVYVDKVQF